MLNFVITTREIRNDPCDLEKLYRYGISARIVVEKIPTITQNYSPNDPNNTVICVKEADLTAFTQAVNNIHGWHEFGLEDDEVYFITRGIPSFG